MPPTNRFFYFVSLHLLGRPPPWCLQEVHTPTQSDSGTSHKSQKSEVTCQSKVLLLFMDTRPKTAKMHPLPLPNLQQSKFIIL
uniref:Uncharacterized protein n=1 Tax=Anguilla anguilla TaxID=7936 RepID=A0A0E9TSB6_ANGAN